MILIVGGTGALGSAAARRLLAKGTAVRVMTRTPEKADELQKLGAEVVQGIKDSCGAESSEPPHNLA